MLEAETGWSVVGAPSSRSRLYIEGPRQLWLPLWLRALSCERTTRSVLCEDDALCPVRRAQAPRSKRRVRGRETGSDRTTPLAALASALAGNGYLTCSAMGLLVPPPGRAEMGAVDQPLTCDATTLSGRRAPSRKRTTRSVP